MRQPLPALFTVRQFGMVGQEIVSPRGRTVAWTVDPALGQLLCGFLNDFITGSDPVAVMDNEEVAR